MFPGIMMFVKSSSFEPSYSNISSSNKSKSDSDRMYFLDLIKIIPEWMYIKYHK